MTVRVLTLLFLMSLCSCSSLQRLAKAAPAKPSAFLAHGAELKKTLADRSPFLLEWRNAAPEVRKAAEKRVTLHVAPVSLDYLRPMTQPLSRVEVRERSRQREARKLADYARQQFIQALRELPQSRYQLVDEPTKDSLRLELALIELNPNAISAGVTRRVINLIAVPGAESIVGRPLKGNLAMEGRVYDPIQKQSLYEFSDAEHNRSALILSVHDYNPYSYARKIIREWAGQLALVLNSPEGAKVKDSPAFTLGLW